MGETEAYFRAHGKKLVEKEDMGEEGGKQYQQERKARQNPMEGTDLRERVSHGCDFQED